MLSLLGPILAPFGDRPFAELYLNDDPAAAPRGGRVVELGGAPPPSGYGVEWFRTHAPHAAGAAS